MKTIKLLPVLLIAIAFIGCKENGTKNEATTEAVVEETTVDVVERASDTHFEQALQAYENGDKPKAVKQINAGIDALEKESKGISGYNEVNLDLAKDQLREMTGKLDDNFDISVEGFKEAVTNAEINVAHTYLGTDAVYVLTPKDKVSERNLHRALDHNLKNLEEGTSKLKGDAKREGERLDAEGKKLKKEYESWKERVEDHTKRVEEHFKKHQPEYTDNDRVYAD